MNESFMQQNVNPNPTETILNIHQISDLPKIVRFWQHLNSDSYSNSDTSQWTMLLLCQTCQPLHYYFFCTFPPHMGH